MSKWVKKREQIERMAKTMTDAQMAEVFGLTRARMCKIRIDLGIPVYTPKPHAKMERSKPMRCELYFDGVLPVKRFPAMLARGCESPITARPRR